jgi:hypothetical protein
MDLLGMSRAKTPDLPSWGFLYTSKIAEIVPCSGLPMPRLWIMELGASPVVLLSRANAGLWGKWSP